METNSTCPDSTCKLRNRVTGYCQSTGPCIMVKPKPENYEIRKVTTIEGLTKIGYEDIINRILNRTVQPPNDMRVETLDAWLIGYAKCQSDVLEIISKLKDQCGR